MGVAVATFFKHKQVTLEESSWVILGFFFEHYTAKTLFKNFSEHFGTFFRHKHFTLEEIFSSLWFFFRAQHRRVCNAWGGENSKLYSNNDSRLLFISFSTFLSFFPFIIVPFLFSFNPISKSAYFSKLKPIQKLPSSLRRFHLLFYCFKYCSPRKRRLKNKTSS